jgi:hypothetical protein
MRRLAPTKLPFAVTLAVVGTAACVVAACEEAEAPRVPLDVQSADLEVPAATSEVVSGTLDGEPFTVMDARFRIDREEGRERVDLLLSEAETERCGLPLARTGRRVWMRWPGVMAIPTGEVRGDPGDDEGAVSVHYEVPVEHHMRGSGGGAFVVSITVSDDETVEGVLDIRFDDGRGSAVAGRFEAEACVGEIDRRLPREGPGLETPPAVAEP